MTVFDEELWLNSLIEGEDEEKEEEQFAEEITSELSRDLYAHIGELYCILAFLILTIVLHHVSLPYGVTLVSSSTAALSQSHGGVSEAHLDTSRRWYFPRPQAAPREQEVGTGAYRHRLGRQCIDDQSERFLENVVRPVDGLKGLVRSPPRAARNENVLECDLVSPFWKGGHLTAAGRDCQSLVVPDGFFLNERTLRKNIWAIL